MKRSIFYSIIAVLAIVLLYSSQSTTSLDTSGFPERVKISLREVGDQLLKSNGDSTSLVMPITEVNASKFKLSFEKNLSFGPGKLVSLIQTSFNKMELPEYYRVEVLQCEDEEVAYSYEMSANEENTLIPCASRILPTNCYTIEVLFTKRVQPVISTPKFYYLLGFIALAVFGFLFYAKKRKPKSIVVRQSYTAIGRYKFYPDQNKLVKEAVEIGLSKKECELLAIFISNPNNIIKRDELTKKVWEDNGVFVGRSLDTYISKLRKKLQEDESIKITNVHGVGYKLEILQ